MTRWSPGAEEQRDALLSEMTDKERLKFEKALEQILGQIEMFPKSARISNLTRRRYDIRGLIFAGGYRLTYVIPEPDEILILSLLPPGTSQALD